MQPWNPYLMQGVEGYCTRGEENYKTFLWYNLFFKFLCCKLWKCKTLILKLLCPPTEYPSHRDAASAQNWLHDMLNENRCCKIGVPCWGRAVEADLVSEMEKWLDRTSTWLLFLTVGLTKRTLERRRDEGLCSLSGRWSRAPHQHFHFCILFGECPVE